MTMPQQQHTGPFGVRARTLLIVGLLVAIAVAVVLVLVYSGGGSGSGGGGY
jgi:hypothetical protein